MSWAGERLTATLMCSGQFTASAHAAFKTHSPSGTINPVSSAIGMKSTGRHEPARRVIPPQQGFESVDLVRFQNNKRLVELELLAGERLAQVHLQFAPHLHARVHLGLEETEGAAPVGFGIVKCHVCIPQELVEFHGIHRRN